MPNNGKTHEEIIEGLREENLRLSIKLKHLENDYYLTQGEYEDTTKQYLEILSNLEKVVNERTKKVKDIQVSNEQQIYELQSMLDAISMLLYCKDRDLCFILVNRKFCDLLGLEKNTVIGKTSEELFAGGTGPESEADARILKTGKVSMKKAEQVTTQSGVRTLQVDRIPYRNEAGELIGMIGCGIDITDG